MDYPVTLERESPARVRVSFPDFPTAFAEGTDEDDSLKKARQVLASAIDAHIRQRRAVPQPSSVTSHRIPVPALIEAKIRLYEAMRAANLGKADLARRLRWHLPQVDRLFDVRHASRLEQLEAAFSALGKRLVLDIRDDGKGQDAAGPRRSSARSQTGHAGERTEASTGAPPFEAQWD